MGFQALDTRLMVVADESEPLADGFVGQVVEADGRVGQIVEQGFEVLVEKRQPVLHARVALACADRFIESASEPAGPNCST